MKNRTFILYRTQWMSLAHKLRHDLLSEIVVGLCSVILAATFFYVFRDFLQEQVRQLSETMFQHFARIGSHLILTAGSVATIRSLRRARRPDTPSLWETAHLLGEGQTTLLRFRLLWLFSLALAILVLTLAAGIWLTSLPVMTQTLHRFGWLYVTVIAMVTSLPVRQGKSVEQNSGRDKPLSLLSWRLRWWRHARIAHFCLLLGICLFAIAGSAAFAQLPAFVPSIASYAGGLLLAIPLTFQLADDLEVAWIERALGVSHEEFLKAYDQMGIILGAIAACLTAVLMAQSGLYNIIEVISAAGAAATPALIEPAVMFQIDGRRPAITIMILILVSLFVATAIIAHPLSLLLLFLLKYYARTTQEGRFYRA